MPNTELLKGINQEGIEIIRRGYQSALKRTFSYFGFTNETLEVIEKTGNVPSLTALAERPDQAIELTPSMKNLIEKISNGLPVFISKIQALPDRMCMTMQPVSPLTFTNTTTTGLLIAPNGTRISPIIEFDFKKGQVDYFTFSPKDYSDERKRTSVPINSVLLRGIMDVVGNIEKSPYLKYASSNPVLKINSPPVS